MGPPQKKELKKNVPPPEHPVSTQDTNFSSPPPIPAKTRHERKNKSSNEAWVKFWARQAHSQAHFFLW